MDSPRPPARRPPAVSVVMTVYNGERYLQAALDSLAAQSFDDWELIVVDDGSDDGTSELLDRLRDDRGARVLARPRLGRSRAMNLALRHARGRYVANLDADDLARPERLRRQVAFLERHPDVGLLGTAWERLDEIAGTVGEVHPPVTDPELRRALLRRCPFLHSAVMMRAELVDRLGGYDERRCVASDYHLWSRMATVAKIANLPQVLATKRIHRRQFFAPRPLGERLLSVLATRWLVWTRVGSARRPLDVLQIANPIVPLKHSLGWRYPRLASCYRALRRGGREWYVPSAGDAAKRLS